MKNLFKVFVAMRSIAIIALVAVIGFSFAACGGDDGGGDNNNNNNSGSSGSWTTVDLSSIFGENNQASNGIYAIAYGNDKYVVGGYVYINSEKKCKIAYSSDGVKWTPVDVSSIFDYSIDAIAYGNGKFVAVGYYGYKVAISTDSVTWTEGTCNIRIKAIAYGNGIFVGVGYDGKIATSSDGLTWTAIDTGTIFDYVSYGQTRKTDILSIAYGNGNFVALGGFGTKMAYSSNGGATWTAVDASDILGTNASSSSSTIPITFGNNKFIIAGTGNKIATSMDGTTWTVTDSVLGGGLGAIYGLAYGNNKFVFGDVTGDIASSTDGGVTWKYEKLYPYSYFYLKGIAYGKDKFVVAGGSNIAYSTWK